MIMRAIAHDDVGSKSDRCLPLHRTHNLHGIRDQAVG